MKLKQDKEDTFRDEVFGINPVYIIGNGVIAKALAVVLTINGRKVTTLRGSVDIQSAYSKNILS